ncbi:YczE/YyaS/YitT family protein [Youngiibacter fragilis]|uniref:YitT family protein n=1 Tax=Youngiibacter fragilis 232.1 TaxID=994573 RepID=V7I6C2_9CLOT|nr:hypothetical protein [Youngiibacter fragilis]ETA80744.1 hypothetical protein T472_0210075 [Youngiibacter fragilis 232.1]
MKDKPNVLVKKMFLSACSSTLVAIGVCLFLQSRLGSDPITVWLDGVRHSLRTSIGNASLINNSIMLSLALIFARKYIYVGTVMGSLIVGPMMNLFDPIIVNIFSANPTLYMRFVMMAIGQVILCMGTGLNLSLKFGFGTTDSIIVTICDHLKLKYRNMKIIFDLGYTIAGILLGGVFGIGSVVGVLTGGPMIAFFMRFINGSLIRKLKLNEFAESVG